MHTTIYSLNFQIVWEEGITQELRTLSRIHGIPVITATQTSKIGDNVGRTLTNEMIGESYKKVKFQVENF